jgi:pre-mRNA-processing factor 19
VFAVSLFCAISGQPPLHPVLSSKSGHVYEKELVLKYLKENEGKDPITGDNLTEDDLVEIKTGKLSVH